MRRGDFFRCAAMGVLVSGRDVESKCNAGRTTEKGQGA
jgi:hypothetical protein